MVNNIIRLNPELQCKPLTERRKDDKNEKPVSLRYHGRWILTKNRKKIFFAVQIEKTEINILQKEWGKKLFYFLR